MHVSPTTSAQYRHTGSTVCRGTSCRPRPWPLPGMPLARLCCRSAGCQEPTRPLDQLHPSLARPGHVGQLEAPLLRLAGPLELIPFGPTSGASSPLICRERTIESLTAWAGLFLLVFSWNLSSSCGRMCPWLILSSPLQPLRSRAGRTCGWSWWCPCSVSFCLFCYWSYRFLSSPDGRGE